MRMSIKVIAKNKPHKTKNKPKQITVHIELNEFKCIPVLGAFSTFDRKDRLLF